MIETPKYGLCVRDMSRSLYDELSQKTIHWHSVVYKKESSYVKKGTPWIIDDEYRILSIVGDGIYFPKIINSGIDGEEHWIEISAMPGKHIFNDLWRIRVWDIRNYAFRLLSLLEILYAQDIIHRDIQHENIIVSKDGNISIIDFAWAIDFRKDKNYVMPKLGLDGSPDYGYSDFYNIAIIFENRYGKMPFVKTFTNVLKEIDWLHYSDAEYVKEHIAEARKELAKHFNIIDLYEFMNAKYKLYKYLFHPIKAFKRLFNYENIII